MNHLLIHRVANTLSGSFNIVTDLMLIALPIPILLRVQLSLPK
jgi:hypothetical protein